MRRCPPGATPGSSPRGALGLALALVLCAAWLAPQAGRAAELRRMESVGVFPVGAAGSNARAPRDGAVRAAVAEAVGQVAQGLLPEDWRETSLPPDGKLPRARPGDIAPELQPALGSDPFEYATRFRTLEDRGSREALFTSDTGADREYVVMVEVFVDVDRVRERLRAAGWIAAPAGPEHASHVRLVLTGLRSFEAYAAVRRTLLDDLRVRSAQPVELSRGHVVLSVDGPYGPEELETALRKRATDGLRVVPLERDGQTLTLLVDWTAPPGDGAPPADAAAPGPRRAP